jgi:L-alanine-DL-glutamate epimerase-like enolase superfamily enzyme
MAAREGIGPDATLMVDVGQIFGEDVDAVANRAPLLEEASVLWLEEPFTAAPTGPMPRWPTGSEARS